MTKRRKPAARAERIVRLGKLLDQLPEDRQRVLQTDRTLDTRTRPRARATRTGRKGERHS